LKPWPATEFGPPRFPPPGPGPLGGWPPLFLLLPGPAIIPGPWALLRGPSGLAGLGRSRACMLGLCGRGWGPVAPFFVSGAGPPGPPCSRFSPTGTQAESAPGGRPSGPLPKISWILLRRPALPCPPPPSVVSMSAGGLFPPPISCLVPADPRVSRAAVPRRPCGGSPDPWGAPRRSTAVPRPVGMGRWSGRRIRWAWAFPVPHRPGPLERQGPLPPASAAFCPPWCPGTASPIPPCAGPAAENAALVGFRHGACPPSPNGPFFPVGQHPSNPVPPADRGHARRIKGLPRIPPSDRALFLTGPGGGSDPSLRLGPPGPPPRDPSWYGDSPAPVPGPLYGRLVPPALPCPFPHGAEPSPRPAPPGSPGKLPGPRIRGALLAPPSKTFSGCFHHLLFEMVPPPPFCRAVGLMPRRKCRTKSRASPPRPPPQSVAQKNIHGAQHDLSPWRPPHPWWSPLENIRFPDGRIRGPTSPRARQPPPAGGWRGASLFLSGWARQKTNTGVSAASRAVVAPRPRLRPPAVGFGSPHHVAPFRPRPAPEAPAGAQEKGAGHFWL